MSLSQVPSPNIHIQYPRLPYFKVAKIFDNSVPLLRYTHLPPEPLHAGATAHTAPPSRTTPRDAPPSWTALPSSPRCVGWMAA